MSKHQIILISVILVLCLAGCRYASLSENASVNEIPVTSLATPTVIPTTIPKVEVPTRLNLAFGTLPTTLDPHRTSDIVAEDILRFVCQGLIGLGQENLLITGWESSSDNMSMTFFLRQDVQFRDGVPFDAEAVLYSLGRLQEPEAESSPLYETFQGVHMEAIDSYTIIFKFDQPRTDFLDAISNTYAAIISPLSDEATIGTDPICTGAYYVKEWQPEEFILLTRNEKHNTALPSYENHGPAYIDEVKIHLIETHEERFQALLDGVLDANHINTKAELEIIKDRPDDFRLSTGHWLGGITYLGFNYARAPLTELKVRQALAHAIDKNGLIDAVLADEFAIPAVSLLSPRTFGYSESLADVEYKFDLTASQHLLAEAGFADNDGDGILERNGKPLQLHLLTTNDNIYLDMATLIQSQFGEIGVDVDIQQATRTEIAEITPTGEFDLLLYDYNWPFPSALELFLSSERIGTTNRVAYSNPEVDKLLTEISMLEDNANNDDIREAKIIEAQRLIILDVPWQPILARRVVSAVNTQIVGEKVSESGAMLWHDARIIENP